mmetsp:Transcript_2229/g.3202  ORF Transcript_2229/g.3202 Transcript_2229/m.3202 type:complete len:91 (+) Transcript_2229:21-293(+)
MKDPPFKYTWAVFGVVIATISLVNFLVNILVNRDWQTYFALSELITFINFTFLLPTWLLRLGCQMPRAIPRFMFDERNQNPDYASGDPLS